MIHSHFRLPKLTLPRHTISSLEDSSYTHRGLWGAWRKCTLRAGETLLSSRTLWSYLLLYIHGYSWMGTSRCVNLGKPHRHSSSAPITRGRPRDPKGSLCPTPRIGLGAMAANLAPEITRVLQRWDVARKLVNPHCPCPELAIPCNRNMMDIREMNGDVE